MHSSSDSAPAARPERSRLARVPGAAWACLLLLPNLTIAARVNAWEMPPWAPVAAGVWFIAALWVLLPRRTLVVLTCPVVIAGVGVVAADRLRSADAVELLSVAYTFRRAEVVDALQPYIFPALLVVAAVLALGGLAWRSAPARFAGAMKLRAGVMVTGALLAIVLPAASWPASWPAALVAAFLAGQSDDLGLPSGTLSDRRASPRDRFATWDAQRGSAPPRRETYVLVIGESIRADRIPGCGGRSAITAPRGLVFCDVLSGASGTHASVPLLVSRDRPGITVRVPRDGTVLKAFEAVGFDTTWISSQERMIAWPDANNQVFVPGPGRDRDLLLPMLDAALARPPQHKAIVLHAYNAHSPYIDRYDPTQAPFAADRARLAGSVPRGDDLQQWWDAYDDAVDESMRFLDAVIARVQDQGGDGLVVFTPDHAENMLDDARGLTGHALKQPTWWDTHVPLVIWASRGWQARHAQQWQMLSANQDAPLMHMDVVPTLLGAAGIGYREPRPEAVDLTTRVVPVRNRYTQVRPGRVVGTMELLRDAEMPRVP